MITRLGFTYRDAYTLPVWKREFFVKTFIESENKQIEESQNKGVYKKTF